MQSKSSQLKVQWIGEPDLITHEDGTDGEKITKYYRKCKYKDLELSLNDFVNLATDDSNYENFAIINLLYDYDNGKSKKIGVYRYYSTQNLNSKKGINFNRKYEVIQDCREVHPISFNSIINKNCYVRFTEIDNDNELDGVQTNKYNDMYFCRYKIDDDSGQLKPVKLPNKSSLHKTPTRSTKKEKPILNGTTTPKTNQNSIKSSTGSSTPNVVLVDIKQIQKNVISPIKNDNNMVKQLNGTCSPVLFSDIDDDGEEKNDENRFTEDEEVSPSKRKKLTTPSTLNHSACRNLMDSLNLNDASIGDDLNVTHYSVVKTPKKKDTDIVLTLRRQERSPRKRNIDYDTAIYGTPKKVTDRICERRKSILKTPGSKTIDTPRRKVIIRSPNETPTKKRTNQIDQPDSDDTSTYRTPKRRSTSKKTPQQNENERTPRSSKRKTIAYDALTPSIGKRSSPVCRKDTGIHIARERLHVSAVPQCLPCRDTEFNNIYSFIKGKITDKCGGCMYVSGVPGTGKTATVTAVIRELQASQLLSKKFEFIEINGMKITEPRQAYVQMYRQLSGKTVLWEHAKNLLEKHFTTNASRRITTVLLVDELDILCNRRQDVVYNLLDWPTKTNAQLVVITIANTMDLPERLLMGRVTSRLGLTRLTFQPYTFKQLQEVITGRLVGTDSFRSNAVELVARKVASVSGDCRRALDICRRATEIAENSNTNSADNIIQVSMEHVKEALNEMIASVNVQAIKSCSKMEKLFLQAVVAEVTRTGIEEITFLGAYTQMESLATLMDITLPPPGRILMISVRLGTFGLIICSNSRDDLYQKILLNVSADDVHYAVNN